MTPDTFQALLDTYGSDLSRWPEVGSDAVSRVLARHPAARQALARAVAEENGLAANSVPPPLRPADRTRLVNRIMNRLETLDLADTTDKADTADKGISRPQTISLTID